MKVLIKIISLAIIFYLVFLYRHELTGYIGELTGSGNRSTIANASWYGLREQALEAYELGEDPAQAILLMEDYLGRVEQELQRHDYRHQGIQTTRHDVVCELSLIHNKLGLKHYQLGNEDQYYYHRGRYRDYLARCSEELQDQHGQ